MTSTTTISNHAEPVPANVQVGPDNLRLLRFAIYSYFALWLIEGALRKWILPGLSAPLLIVRDPVLLFIYLEAFRQKTFKMNWFTTFILVIGTLSTVVSMGLENAPPLKVIGFGIHTDFLHLPLIFLIPQVFNYSHVKKIGNAILWIAPLMAILVAMQFLSSSASRLNTGAGGEGKMIETALGRIRPSGTFSFTTGLAEYSVLLAACLIHHLLERKVFSQLAFLLAAPSLLVLVVMSGSRTVFGLIALQILAMIAIWVIKPRFLQSSIKIVAIGFLVVTVIGSIEALQTGMDVILARFGDKDEVKVGFFMRFVDEFTKTIDIAAKAPVGGVGIGMGTNAASSMLYSVVKFSFGESEMERVIMEMGPFLATPYLLSRFAVVFIILGAAVSALKKDNNTFPLLLITASANDLIQGQFGQSTVIGFAVMVSGLALAATHKNPETENALPIEKTDTLTPRAVVAPYAAQLRAEIEERVAARNLEAQPLAAEMEPIAPTLAIEAPLNAIPAKKRRRSK